MIFNSLGSNYSFNFVIKSLFAFNTSNEKEKLKKFLDEKYEGNSILLYKGREAIKLALELLELPKGSKVGISGFTCYAVYQAVTESGCVPEYIDIERNTLNFGLNELEKHKDIRALIIQNTLGVPCDITAVKAFCKKNGTFLIEDLAHSIGVKYTSGEEAGTMGDFTALSFSQDKSVDAISGGALIVRDNKHRKGLDRFELTKLEGSRQVTDRFYPLFTFLIRKTYMLGAGKALHYLLKKMNLLSKPMPTGGSIKYHNLPFWYCSLVNYQFSNLGNLLDHRVKIANLYKKAFRDSPPGLLRFPIFISNRSELIKYLGKKGFFVSDIWYDAPIAPIRYMKLTNYSGGCPVSEKVSEEIMNLPTHINVSEIQAKELVNNIKEWKNIH